MAFGYVPTRVLRLLASCGLEVATLGLLTALLRWEPEVAVRACRRSCLNKLEVVEEFGLWLFSFDLAGEVTEDGRRWLVLKLLGGFKLQDGDYHMTASACRHVSRLRWQPLRTPLLASVQPPQRRPFQLRPGISRCCRTKWFVPGVCGAALVVELPTTRRWRRTQGPDCFFQFSFRVLDVKFLVLVVFPTYVLDQSVICPPMEYSS